jgi:hypothetical protein
VIELKVTPISNTEWKLLAPIEYKVFDHKYVVPEGFITDFASIPQAIWNIAPPWNIHWGAAAVLHDYLYQDQLEPRDFADKIFLQCMKDCGAAWHQRTVFYLAVRAFGGPIYANTSRSRK